MATIIDKQAGESVDLLIEAESLERIAPAVDRLEEREATILRMRFGLDPYSPMTLGEIGIVLGLTRERIRQIASQAIQRLAAELENRAQEDSPRLDMAM
jgi:RNA polymerase primary sigma factor